MLTVEIAGTDRTSWLGVESMRIRRELGWRTSMRARLVDKRRGYIPTPGERIRILDGNEVLFRGWLWRIESRREIGTASIWHEVECVDVHHLAARRTISGSYSGWMLPSVLYDITSRGMTGEMIDVSPDVPNIPIQDTLTFDYVPVAHALNAIADLLGYIWYIDNDLTLHMGQFSTWNAPFSITDNSGNYSEISVTRSLEDYRNYQHVRFRLPQVPGDWEDTRIFPGPGQWMLSTSWPIGEMLEIRVNDQPMTFIGVSPPDTPPSSGYDFYYFVSAGGIYNLDYQPEGGEFVVIRYRAVDPWGQYSSGVAVATEYDADEIDRMQALAGGSGIWEAVEDTRVATTQSGAQALAQARLRRHARRALQMRVRLKRRDIVPGMQVTVDSQLLGISQSLLCERTETEWIETGGDSMVVRTTAELTDAEPAGGPGSYLGRLVDMARLGAGGWRAAQMLPMTTDYVGGHVLYDEEQVRDEISLQRYTLYGTETGVDCTVVSEALGYERYDRAVALEATQIQVGAQ